MTPVYLKQAKIRFLCLICAKPKVKVWSSTRVVTKINGHGDKRSSEIPTQKQFKSLNNNITQTKIMESMF